MLLPLLIGDQRRLVLLLLSLPQLPLLVRLDAPTSASTGVYKINFNWKRLKMELKLPKPHANISFNLWPSSECSFCCHTESEALLDLIGLIRRKEDRTNWIGERKSKSSNYALIWWNAYMRNHDISGLSRKTRIRKEFYLNSSCIW